MSTVKKKLVFKGLEKKEQILFKSFLNLAKNDLEYEVELIQDPDASMDGVDIVITDAAYEYSGFEKVLVGLPTLRIGDDTKSAAKDYLVRPVQWSDFKTGLMQLSLVDEPEEERVLPTNLNLAVVNEQTFDDYDDSAAAQASGSKKTDEDEVSRSFIDAPEYDFSLDKMSIDYESFTSNEYEKVADDVRGFNKEGDSAPAVMLVTDDESSNTNSVLVIETNSLDAWDMSESEFNDIPSTRIDGSSELELPDLGARERRLVQGKLEAGVAIECDDQIWMSEQEVMAGSHTLFYICPAERKVYSTREPGRWITPLRTKELTSVPLTNDWKPAVDLKAYPIERLIWITTLVARNDKLDDGAQDNQEFMLLKWPHFELLELDNVLLKITTMLFVGPESAYSLMQKTGEGRAVIYGMLNACKELGVLVDPGVIESHKANGQTQGDGVFGKIKDVFR